ncbi:MAG: hypothetical protein AAF519_06265 [Bacteroidota bacterium]
MAKKQFPTFIGAKVENGSFVSFKITGTTYKYLILRDDQNELLYYDTEKEEFLTIDKVILDLKVVSPELFKL